MAPIKEYPTRPDTNSTLALLKKIAHSYSEHFLSENAITIGLENHVLFQKVYRTKSFTFL